MLDIMKIKKIAIPETPIRITEFATTGQGIGILESNLQINSQNYSQFKGIKVFLWNTIPGETITKFEITRQKSHFIEGIATEIKNYSKSRTNPKDTQFLSTSPWQILTEQAELAAKSTILTSLFSHLPQSNQKELVLSQNIPIHKSPNNYFYRNKMEYALYFDHQSETIKPAVHFRGSHLKVPITTSSLELPAIFEQATQIITELNNTHQDARKYQSLLLRANQSGKVSGGLLENGKPRPVFQNLTDTILGSAYTYSPSGFFQINLPVYELVLSKIKDFLVNSESILDLYAGVGTIGLTVAKDKNLTLVEVNTSAFDELNSNSQHIIQETHNPNIHPVLAKSEAVLDLITDKRSIILDPPRAGCDEKLIQKLCEIKPEKIVYLSCNPITQVRDLTPLLNFYQINYLEGYNFFPRTPHIESLVFLTKL